MAEELNLKLHDDLNTEYYKLVGIVSDFDKNLLTVKGWGVTLGLAGLAWGFQNQHYGLFLVAGLSGVAFWVIEGVMKRHQMRYYARMRKIEVVSYELFGVKLSDGSKVSAPQIDWSWAEATKAVVGQEPVMAVPNISFVKVSTQAHVALPHLITMAVGCLLFILGLTQTLKMPL